MERSEIPGITAWVRNWPGVYMVSSKGRAYSWKSGKCKELKLSFNMYTGHKTIFLTSSSSPDLNEKWYIHRLIYSTFLNVELKKGQWIKHLDGEVSNNALSNLELNEKHERKFSPILKYAVVEQGGKEIEFTGLIAIGRQYGLDIRTIKRALKTGEFLEVFQKKNLD